MPFVPVNGGNLHYQLEGRADAPVLVLSNSLGTNLHLWDKQVAEFSKHFRILRYDSRGHGRSVASPGPCSIEMLARDVATLLDSLHVIRAHFCGLSMGGMIGMWLGARMPDRINKLVLANTGPYMGPREGWDTRIAAVEKDGMPAITEMVLERWFTAPFRERSPGDVEAVRKALLSTPSQGYTACCAAIRDMDQRSDLANIRAKTLVIGGTQDPATPPDMCRGLSEAIPGARYLELATAHLSNIEAADQFNTAVKEFLLA